MGPNPVNSLLYQYGPPTTILFVTHGHDVNKIMLFLFLVTQDSDFKIDFLSNSNND